ncbi:MAG TPA: dynamin family protein, partial [Pilimelia sp.]|nr:dynamin family protein [Pilimelia sp.]
RAAGGRARVGFPWQIDAMEEPPPRGPRGGGSVGAMAMAAGDPGAAAAGARTRGAPVDRALAELAKVRRVAAASERHDLVERVDAARAVLLVADVPVAVVGEFKQGKSTLVNALLRTDVCPVDADIVTAVPTIITYGVPPAVLGYPTAASGEAEPDPVSVPFAKLRDYVTEAAAGAVELRSVEVRLDRALLRGGLSFIDTPGVGGLNSAQGNLTLGTLPLARAALFVTDAAQELTAPEMDFLARTVERCPSVICVVTKTDLHVEWRRIVELNHGHLARAGLSVPIVPVSSFLRLRAGAKDSAALNAESGFPPLLDLLRKVVAGADLAAARVAQQEVALVSSQLREQLGAERAAVRDPAVGAELAERLAEKARRAQGLAAGTASWQTVLTDGIQDLTTDVDHDLRERLRGMLRRGEALLDASDPKDTWREFEAWAAREASAAAVDNLFALLARTEQLAREVAERFNLDYDSIDLDLPAPTVSLARVSGLDPRFDKSSMRQFLGAFTAARLTYGGLFMLGAFGSLLPLTFAAPLGLAVGLALGRKLVRDERERQVEQRRLQAKQELRRYVDEVAFVVGKDSRDAVRRTQRFLRDEFTARAGLAQRSSTRALAAVRESGQLAEPERARRARDLDSRWADLDKVKEPTPATPAVAPAVRPVRRSA